MNCQEFEDENAPFDLFWDQLRLGTTYYQVVGLDADTLDATAWFVLLYMPLWPRGRYRLRRKGSGWERSQRRPLSPYSVVQAYLSAYLLYPTAFITPMLPFFKEVFPLTGLPSWSQVPGICVVLTVYIVLFWKALDRHEKSFETAVNSLRLSPEPRPAASVTVPNQDHPE